LSLRLPASLHQRAYVVQKKSLFFDERASGAEKSHRFLTREPPAQKKVTVF